MTLLARIIERAANSWAIEVGSAAGRILEQMRYNPWHSSVPR